MSSVKPMYKTIIPGTHAYTNQVCEFAGPSITYAHTQSFVEERYYRAYKASINCDFPTMMAVSSLDGQLLSVGGIRISTNPLFLEHYLDLPVEQVLTNRFCTSIGREKIVEVGNLAGGENRLATAYLMHNLWETLIKAGYEYLVMTSTESLLGKFRRLPLYHLADAKADSIPYPQSWGSYYKNSPIVVAGRLKDYDFRFFRNIASAPFRVDLLNRRSEQ